MSAKPAPTLVIGGSGFIGAHLVRHLRDDPFFGTVYSPTSAELNLLDADQVIRWLADLSPRFIVNLAGYATIRNVDSMELFGRNTVSVVNLLHAIQQLGLNPRVVTCSSAYVYAPDIEGRISEGDVLTPRNLYAVSKIAAENVVSVFGDLSVSVVRIFNAFGVGQSSEFLLPKVIQTVVDRDFPLKLNNLHDRRDFIDVRDLCVMFDLVLKAENPPKVINFCNGKSISVSEIIDTIQKILGCEIPVVCPNETQSAAIVQGDNSRISALGYRQRYTLQDSVAWMLDEVMMRRTESNATEVIS